MTPHASASATLLCLIVVGCSAPELPPVAWDESNPEQGQLSGNPPEPTPLTLSPGDNRIIGTSVPGPTEECIDLPDGSQAPYYPEHETYIDVFSFSLPANQRLAKIIVVDLEVEQVHSSCGMPLEEQLGAFTGLAKSDRIDWNSDTFEIFVRLPSENPLIGAGFARDEGEDLIVTYKGGLVFGPIVVDAMTDGLSNGTYTFWWKEGAPTRTRIPSAHLVFEPLVFPGALRRSLSAGAADALLSGCLG